MRLYLDTSVLSALFDDRSPERKRLTEDFFGIVGHHEPYVSELTLAEIELTPDENLRSRMQARCADLPVLSGKERPPAEDAQYSRPGECGIARKLLAAEARRSGGLTRLLEKRSKARLSQTLALPSTR